MAGQYECHVGYYGAACDEATVEGRCPNRCSNRGLCVQGACMCFPPNTGADCSKREAAALKSSIADCASKCVHGRCDGGSCTCDPNWTGTDCSQPLCPNGCTMSADGSANGVCSDGRCVCSAGYSGEDCSVECPNRCSGHGTCSNSAATHSRDSYRCYCESGFMGNDCSQVAVRRSGLTLSSLVGIALVTFAVGLVAIPLAKAYVDRRDRKRWQEIMGGHLHGQLASEFSM